MANTLLHSPADIVRRVLIALGLGVDPPSTPWPIYCDSEPGAPDNCLTLYDTTGKSDGRAMKGGELFTHYGIQVRIRAVDHPTGYLKADAIRCDMARTIYDRGVTIAGTAYLLHCLARISEVLILGTETGVSKRHLFTINALASLKKL